MMNAQVVNFEMTSEGPTVIRHSARELNAVSAHETGGKEDIARAVAATLEEQVETLGGDDPEAPVCEVGGVVGLKRHIGDAIGA